MTDYLNDSADQEFSKTRRKKEMIALQELGEELLQLSNDRLKHMSLPENLLEALREYKRIPSHGAGNRQEQYIGKLMRDIDPEPIRQQLAVIRGESAEHTGWLHLLERWRERLMSDDKLLATFIADYPESDAQYLRTLIRNARKEQQDNKPPKSFRLLFQALKEIIPEPGKPAGQQTEEDEE